MIAQLLQPANDVLNAAAPGLGLPQLQRELFGSAVMGYGDLFVAGVFGAIVGGGTRPPGRGGKAHALLAILFDLLFFAVDLLPATVPVALAVVLTELGRRRAARPRRSGRRGRRGGRLAPASVSR